MNTEFVCSVSREKLIMLYQLPQVRQLALLETFQNVLYEPLV